MCLLGDISLKLGCQSNLELLHQREWKVFKIKWIRFIHININKF